MGGIALGRGTRYYQEVGCPFEKKKLHVMVVQKRILERLKV